MSSNLHWDEWAEAVVTKLVRPKEGDAFLILADTATDPGMAQACLSAGLRAGADTQLLIYKRMAWLEAVHFGPIVSDGIRASRLILGLHTNFMGIEATREALAKGARILCTQPWGIEDFLIRGFLDVDYEAMVRNGELMTKLWDETKECHVVSDEGTDIRFQMAPCKSSMQDGILTEDGEMDFFPGVQVSIAFKEFSPGFEVPIPIEETINGKIVVDASDNIQGVLRAPYTIEVEKGIVKAVKGGVEANKLRVWMETRNDESVYHVVHFTVGLNPKAGISGNMIEDERLLGCVDFGFGKPPYHWDVVLASPTIYLDGKVMSEGNKLNYELGFEEV